jgi:membrane protein
MRGFAAVIRALNLAYDLEEARPWIRQRLVAAVLSLGSVAVGALMLAAFVAGPLLGGGQALAEVLGLGDTFASAWAIVRWPIAFGLVVLWAAAVYLLGPNRKSHLSQELPGAVLTALFGLAASAALNVYLRLVAAANPVLGSLGGGMILLLWLYLLSLGLLIGGELNAVLRDRRRKPLLPAL